MTASPPDQPRCAPVETVWGPFSFVDRRRRFDSVRTLAAPSTGAPESPSLAALPREETTGSQEPGNPATWCCPGCGRRGIARVQDMLCLTPGCRVLTFRRDQNNTNTSPRSV